MKFNTIVIIFLSCFILYVIFSNISSPSIPIEGFSFGSFIPKLTDTSTTSDASNNIYQYLAPLPSDNIWSEDTQTAFIKKLNDYQISVDPSATLFTSMDQIKDKTKVDYMKNATDDEANSYIQNGIWPWDTYITNQLNDYTTNMTDQEKTTFDKFAKYYDKLLPNRLMYQEIIGKNTIPQTAILNSLNPNIGTGIPTYANQNLTCKYATKSTIQQPDGTNIVIPEDGFYPYYINAYSLDYNIFSKIPSLTFDSSACNICAIEDFDYLSTNNQCKFSLKTPAAYDIYSGNSQSTPSTV
jgi:hypothetical protein